MTMLDEHKKPDEVIGAHLCLKDIYGIMHHADEYGSNTNYIEMCLYFYKTDTFPKQNSQTWGLRSILRGLIVERYNS